MQCEVTITNDITYKTYPCGPECLCDSWQCKQCHAQMTHIDHPDDGLCDDCFEEQMTMAPIKFYKIAEPYGCFSNFSRYPITIDGKTWASTEHYFQAQKFAGTPYEERVRSQNLPREAAEMGRDRSLPLREDWEQVKDDVMRTAVMAKFSQYPELKWTLLSTGDVQIIEHSKNDSYWADGGDGSGKNMLGIILMETREKLRPGPQMDMLKIQAGNE